MQIQNWQKCSKTECIRGYSGYNYQTFTTMPIYGNSGKPATNDNKNQQQMTIV